MPLSNPTPTPTAAQVGADPAGAAAAAVVTHDELADPHAQYERESTLLADIPLATANSKGAAPQLSGALLDSLRGSGVYGQLVSPLQGLVAQTDFFYSTAGHPAFSASAIAAGTVTSVTGVAEHPGIQRLSGAAAANTGYMYLGAANSQNSVVLAGAEEFVLVFKTPATLTGLMLGYVGFHNSVNETAPTKGTYVSLVGTTATLVGKDSGTTSGAAPYTMSTSTWYRLKITLAADGTAAVELRTCSDQAVVWTDTIASNGKTTTAVTPALVFLDSTGGTRAIVDLDYAHYVIPHVCVR